MSDRPFDSAQGGPPMEEGESFFSLGRFLLPDGHTTHFKIECDVLTEQDWKALARLAVEILPSFGAVEGVPRGGLAFRDALDRYITPGCGRLLIADDVWVSGKSMEAHRAGREANGIVAFSRNPNMPLWAKAIMFLSPAAEDATYRLNKPYGITVPG